MMKKSTLLIFSILRFCGCLLLLNVAAFAQTPHIDSLMGVLKIMKSDTSKANTFHEISRAYLYELNNMEMVNYYATLELELSQKLNYKKGIAYGMLNKGIFYWSIGNYKAAMYHYKKSLIIMKDAGLKKGEGSCYLNIGQTYMDMGNYKDALTYMQKGVKVKEEVGEKRGMSSGFNNIGNLYYFQGKFREALMNHLKSLKLKEELNDKVGISMSYNNIGLVFSGQAKTEEALVYYKKGAAIQEELKDQQGLGNTYSNIGSIYMDKGQLDEALRYNLKAMKARESINEKPGMAQSYNNVGMVYLNQKKMQQALPYLLKSFNLAQQIDNIKLIAESANGVSQLYTAQKNYKLALNYTDQQMTYAKKIDLKEGIRNSYANYSSIYAKLGQFDKAIAYTKLLHNLQDFMLNKDNFKQVTELNTKYETDKKEKAILLLTKDQELTERTLKAQRLMGWGLVGGLGLLFISVFSVYRRYQFKQKANLILEKQKAEIENKNLLITDSIDYAKNIQELILPNPHKVQHLFPESFILYEPKSVVSGDFYWISKMGSKLICAVTDCTGHGVPGAFMSLLGFNMLENVVKKNKIVQPSKILDSLNQEVVTRLTQTENIEDIKHGMDIAVISIDTETNQLQYAGAHNQIYIIRGEELIEIKANNKTIGFDNRANAFQYENKSLDLKKGDMIYLFTDGFPDQFGGPSRKKFYYAPFRALLRSISALNPEIQRQKLEEAYTNWRDGKVEQIDDILIMGIRY
jgi:serine phosphatase RsbU (regulator of sigma subunit)